MTQVAVPADPPREGLVLPKIATRTPLSESGAVALYEAALGDVVRAVARSGGDLLVTYRADEDLPEKHRGGDAESEVRDVVEPALAGLEGDPHAGDPRFEVQVGSDPTARAGNTITHLLENEGATSAAVLSPTAPLAGRTRVDSAAVKLRSSAVVVGPAPEGRTYYAGFSEPIDFAGAFAPPAVESLAARATEEGHDVDFMETVPTVETPADLRSTVALIRARRAAGRRVPEHTTRFVLERGLRVREDDGERILVTE